MPSGRVSSGRVVLRSDLPPDRSARLAADADEFLKAVCAYLGTAPPSPTVYLFSSRAGLWLFLRRECPSFRERTGACFLADDGELVVAAAPEVTATGLPPALRHELVHAAVSRCVRPMPWLDEGLAQVLEGGFPPVADASRERRLAALGADVAPLAERVLTEPEHARLDERDYLVAWGLVWFVLGNERHGPPAVRRCLDPPAARDELPEARTARCLGVDVSEFVREFASYVAELAEE
jgi:hypothetical protein